jgi:preprotein translocase subunit YajC
MFEHLPLMLAQEGEAPLGATPSNNSPVEVGGVAPAPANGTTAAPGNGQAVPPPAAPSPFGNSFILILMAMLLFMVIMSWRTQKAEKKKRESLLGSLKKGDRVQTIGGILGSVVEVKDTEVIVKVDENSNTRMRFTRGAIASVLESKDAAAT